MLDSNLNTSVEFPNMTDEEVIKFIIEHNPPAKAEQVRKLKDGEWILLYKLMFTWSVCCGVSELQTFKYRWCFEDYEEALHFFNTCQEYDEVPVKRNSLVGHRYLTTPRLFKFNELGFPKW